MGIKEQIAAGDLENLTFQGDVTDGHLVPGGLLGDQAAIDDIEVGIYVLEKDGTLISCNKTAIAAWGRTPELGTSEKYCGAFRLRYPSGDVMQVPGLLAAAGTN
jgi:hypothetical protein